MSTPPPGGPSRPARPLSTRLGIRAGLAPADEVARLARALTLLEERVADGERLLGEDRTRRDAELARVEEEMARLAERVEQFSPRFERLSAEVGRISPEVERLSSGIERVSSEIARVAEGLERLAERATGMEDRLARCTGEVARLRDDLARAGEASEEARAHLVARFGVSEQAIEEIAARVEELSGRSARAETTLGERIEESDRAREQFARSAGVHLAGLQEGFDRLGADVRRDLAASLSDALAGSAEPLARRLEAVEAALRLLERDSSALAERLALLPPDDERAS